MTADIIDFGARPDAVAPAKIGATPAPIAESQTVLDVDRWGMRRAEDIADRWLIHTPGDQKPSDVPVVADAHAALFDIDPKPAQRPQDKTRAAWWAQMMQTPEYQALHQQTCLDPDLSELGAATLCRQWLEYAETQQDRPDDAPAPGSDAEPLADTLSRMRSTAKALQDAAADVQGAQDMRAGLGMGAGGKPIDPATFRNHFQRVRNDATLRAVMNLAGRMRMLAQALQRAKVRHGADEIIGIEPTNDPARLIPSELAQLACGIDDVELMALHRLAQRQSLGRSMRARERVGRGPIVVCVDESGSMRGDRIIAAKALALALAWLAHHQRRWIALVGFSGGEEGTRVAFAPGKTDPAALMDWLSHFYGGGTTLDVPLAQVPGSYWSEFVAAGMPEGKTDLIFITDAQVDAPNSMVADFNAWKKAHQAKAYAIVVGGDQPGDLTRVCDRCWTVPSLDLDSIAVAETLSI